MHLPQQLAPLYRDPRAWVAVGCIAVMAATQIPAELDLVSLLISSLGALTTVTAARAVKRARGGNVTIQSRVQLLKALPAFAAGFGCALILMGRMTANTTLRIAGVALVSVGAAIELLGYRYVRSLRTNSETT